MSNEIDKNKAVNNKSFISFNSNENIITKIKKIIGKIEDVSNCHPIITNIIKKTIAIAIEVTLDSALNSTHSQKKGSNHSSKHKYTPKDSNSNSFIYEKKSCDIPLKSQYTANDVPAGKQRYHYKNGSVLWKEKAPYHRSGKKVQIEIKEIYDSGILKNKKVKEISKIKVLNKRCLSKLMKEWLLEFGSFGEYIDFFVLDHFVCKESKIPINICSEIKNILLEKDIKRNLFDLKNPKEYETIFDNIVNMIKKGMNS